MKYDLLIKCFIAFCVGAIIYKFISDRCSCGIVEGQEQNNNTSTPSQEEIDANTAFTQQQMFGDQPELTPPSPIPNMEPITTTNNTTDVPMNNIQDFIKTINDNIFKKSIKETISNVIGALQSEKFSKDNIPGSIDAVSTFEQFGNNSQALDYLELIIIEISNLDSTKFKSFINSLFSTTDYCTIDQDLNAYIISMLLLEYYSIKVDSDLTQEYINISNRLSKYIPDIVEKVQKLNKTCEGKDKKVKSTIMDAMVHRLFKNNNTVINIGSLDSLVNELNKLDRVYGVVILLCITYIVVRFLGMFSMKVEV